MHLGTNGLTNKLTDGRTLRVIGLLSQPTIHNVVHKQEAHFLAIKSIQAQFSNHLPFFIIKAGLIAEPFSFWKRRSLLRITSYGANIYECLSDVLPGAPGLVSSALDFLNTF